MSLLRLQKVFLMQKFSSINENSSIEEINYFLEKFDFSEDSLTERLNKIDSKQMDIFQANLSKMSSVAKQNASKINRKRFNGAIDNIIDILEESHKIEFLKKENPNLEEVNTFINETSEECLYELNDTNRKLFKPHLRQLDDKARAKMRKVFVKGFENTIDRMVEIAKSIPDAEV